MTTVQEKNPKKIQTNKDKKELKEMGNLYGKMLKVASHVMIERPKEYLNELEYMGQTLTKLGEQIDKIIKIGRKYGIPDIEIGNDIRRMAKGRFHASTIRLYLPESAKHVSKKNVTESKYALKNSASTETVTEPEEVADWVKEAQKTQTETETIQPMYQIPVDQYRKSELPKYDRPMLIKIVEWYEQKEEIGLQDAREWDSTRKSLKKEIEELKKENTDLKKRVKELEGKLK